MEAPKKTNFKEIVDVYFVESGSYDGVLDRQTSTLKRLPSEDHATNDSMSMRLKHLNTTTAGYRFMTGAFELVFYSPGCAIIWIILLTAVATACIYFGTTYEGTCSRKPGIKNLLILFGSFGVMKSFMGIMEQIGHAMGCGNEMDNDEKEGYQRHVCIAFIDRIFTGLVLISFIVLSAETFSSFAEDYQSDNPALPAYCDPVLVAFVYWMCIAFILALVLVAILIGILVKLAG